MSWEQRKLVKLDKEGLRVTLQSNLSPEKHINKIAWEAQITLSHLHGRCIKEIDSL